MDETIVAAKPSGRSIDRVSPHSDEAEISVLGAMLLEETAADRAMEILTEDDFHHPAHRHIFRAASGVRNQGHAPDALAVREELRRLGSLDEAGGGEYLARIVDIVPTAANLPYHARIVQDLAVKRRLIRAGTEIVSEAYESADDSDQLLNRAEERIFRLSEHRFKRSFTPIGQLLQGAIMRLETLSSRRESITGAPTGFKDLDELTAGFQLSDLIIVAGRPSMGKCVADDSEITLADGSVATIEEICRRRRARVFTLGDDWQLHTADVSHFVDDGVKPVFRVTTRLGRRVETTLTHPFLTVGGWKPLGEIEVGDRVAVPRELEVFGSRELRSCEVKILAYLIGDGCLTGSAPKFTNSNPMILEDFTNAVEEFGGVAVHREATSGGRAPTLRVRSEGVPEERRAFARRLRSHLDAQSLADYRIAHAIGVSAASVSFWASGHCAPSPDRFARLCAALDIEEMDLAPEGLPSIRHSSRNPLALWIQDLGLMGRRAGEKFIPSIVFTAPRIQIALFLNRLFATDGWATVVRSGQPQLGYCSTSERLARQVQHLLLRFGVIASLRRRAVRYKDGRRTAWQIDVTDHASLRRFVEEIGIHGKEAAIERLRRSLESRSARTNRDLIPVEIWGTVRASLGDRTWADLQRAMGYGRGHYLHVGTRSPSRGRLARIAAALGDPDMERLAASDVYWDEIVTIEPLGYKQVYDLTVPATHNFIANDVCVHNTSFCLNVAAHAAIVEDLPVAVFSLEMSMEQLVQRLISTEALVSLKTLRTGQASSEQWKSVADACDRLRRAAIYIDDSGLLSVHDMRAKARRLKQQRDIGLVIVDYLQLMESGMRAENRQQEITEISRSLKALAKELNIPVIALSQLSRGPEHRADQRPRLADLRESGCLTGDTPVYLPDENLNRPIGELEGCRGFRVLAVDTATGNLEPAAVERAFSTGVKPVFCVETHLGRSIRATANHRFLTVAGWRRLDELKPADRIAVSPSERARLATSDVYWDSILAIEADGEAPVYDLTVERLHNFVAGDVIVHNSLEQDSDLVLFLYRDEYYNPESTDKKGVAEIIIGKNRNGPTGMIELAFLANYMRFENLDAFHTRMP
jgi:replicative DNA helicase